jgi:hypothetical protein
MTEWLYHLPVVWMTVVVFVVTALITGAIYAAVLALATGRRVIAFKAMSPVMLTPLAVVFGCSSHFSPLRCGAIQKGPTLR